MRSSTVALSVLCIFVLLLPFNHGEITVDEGLPPGEKGWCVAKPSTDDVQLNIIINYVCTSPGVTCNVIQLGGQCYEPNTLINHASVVMNLYFQKYGHADHACDFSGSGIIALTDPSYGSCLYSYTQ